MPWYHNPHTGGQKIPPAVRDRTTARLVRYANEHHGGKFTRIDVRFRGALCYIDAFTDPGRLHGEPPLGENHQQWVERLQTTPTHLCRIRYFGDEERWSLAFYTYSNERYEPCFMPNGTFFGSPEEAFEVGARYLG